MKFGSVCSGIEAASVAWGPLGWKAAWFSEIEPFPCAVLKHHYPDVPNLGDMTKLPDLIRSGRVEAPDLLCGGTPCQAFSVAGLRQSLADERGNLSLTFCEIADAIDEKRKSIIFWENVPGVLNTKDNAFGCFLGALAGEDDALVPPGGRWSNAGFIDGPQRTVAWRVLDAQYFGVAQRRRRVFVVASARADFDPAAVLFEFEGFRRDIAPSREARQSVAPTVGAGAPFSRTGNERVEAEAMVAQVMGCEFGPSGGRFTDLNPTLDTRAKDGPIRNQLAGAVITMAHGQGGAEIAIDRTPTLTCNHEAPIAFHPTQDPISSANVCHSLGANSNATAAVAVGTDCYNGNLTGDIAATMGTPGSSINASGPTVMVPICWDEELNASIDQAGTLLRGGDGGRHDGVAVPQPISIHPHCIGRAPEAGPQGKEYLLDGSAYCMDSRGQPQAVAFDWKMGEKARSIAINKEQAPTLGAQADRYAVQIAMQVRRLTPVECERLQGFPDNYTNIKDKCPDGPRYKALGNSWAVPVVRWIGERIARSLG